MILHAVILLFGVFLGAISQVLLKKAALKKFDNKIKEYINPYVITAYTIFVMTTILSVIAYKKVPLSMGPILEATSYIYVTLFAVRFFGEKISFIKAIALALIIFVIVIFTVLG